MSDQLQARGVPHRMLSQQPQQRPSNQQRPGNPGGTSPQRQQQQQRQGGSSSNLGLPRPNQGQQVQRRAENPQQIIARLESRRRPPSPRAPRRPDAPDAGVILGMVGAYAKGGRDGVVAGYKKGLNDGFQKGFVEGIEAGYKMGIRDTVINMLS